MNTIKVDNRIVQDADNMAKALRLPFRDCLDILIRAFLAERAEEKTPASKGPVKSLQLLSVS